MNEKEQLQEKLNLTYNSEGAILQMFAPTLKQFAYRYFETSTGSYQEEIIGKKITLSFFETSMMEALKNKNSKVKQALIDFCKVHAKQKVEFRNFLSVEILNFSGSSGKIKLSGGVQFGDQNFTIDRILNFEDLFDLRKNYPLKLEEICEIF